MKNIVIIGTHPNDKHKMELLEKCIDGIKPLGYDIMVVSHFPVSERIQQKVDYVLYDKENQILDSDSTPDWVYLTENFTVINSSFEGHILAVCKNIVNGVNYAKSLKYDFFYYLEYDNIFHKEDLISLEIARKTMFFEKKKMVFFSYECEGEDILETLIFGGIVGAFHQIHNLPTQRHELPDSAISLERLVYMKYQKFLEEFYLIPCTSKIYFPNSEINKEFTKYFLNVFPSNDNSGLFLFIINLIDNPNPISITINEENYGEFCSGCWHLVKVEEDSEFTVKILSDGVETIKHFIIDDPLKFVKNGYINFKQISES